MTVQYSSLDGSSNTSSGGGSCRKTIKRSKAHLLVQTLVMLGCLGLWQKQQQNLHAAAAAANDATSPEHLHGSNHHRQRQSEASLSSSVSPSSEKEQRTFRDKAKEDIKRKEEEFKDEEQFRATAYNNHDEQQQPQANSKESTKGSDGRDNHSNRDNNSQQHTQVLIVNSIDGFMAGIDKATGKLLWKLDNAHQPQKPQKQRKMAKTQSFAPPLDDDDNNSDDDSQQLLLLEPLLSTTTTTARAVDDWRTAAVPSTDGSVYLTATTTTSSRSSRGMMSSTNKNDGGQATNHGAKDDSESSGSDQDDHDNDETEEEEVTVTTTVTELVARTPFVDRRGRLYTGSRRSMIFAVDASNGQVLKVHDTSGTPNKNNDVATAWRQGAQEANSNIPNAAGSETIIPDEAKSTNTNRFSSNPDWQGRNIVWMGRVDQAIAVHDTKSGASDVQFQSSEIQSVHDMLLQEKATTLSSGGGAGSVEPSKNARQQQKLHPWSEYDLLSDDHWAGLPKKSFVDHNNRNQDDTADEDENNIQKSSLVVTPGGNVALRNLVTGEIEWVADQTFDAPVAFCVDSETGASMGVDVVPDAIAPHGSVDYIAREMERQLEAATASSVVETFAASSESSSSSYSEPDLPQPLVGSLKSGQLFAMPLAVRPLLNNDDGSDSYSEEVDDTSWETRDVSSTVPAVTTSTGSNQEHADPIATGSNSGLLYHNHEKPHSVTKKRPCGPDHVNFPACLVGASRADDPFEKLGYERPLSDGDEDHAVIVPPRYHRTPDYHPRVPPHHYHGHGGRGEYYGHNNNMKYLKLLSSYLVPTILTLFVASFEMGRRKRQRDKEHHKDGHATSAGTASSVGVIQVQEDVILGYGGHGTVVYKGTLEGRQVAVKRMLKAYHASADREISLLIESDGHTNVVRYFLKEVRGDFVYLALELCDLSLHDLINTLHGHVETQPSTVPASTRTILSQIANGVSHLHRLRIVHRDMKPANILLADSKKSKRKSEKNESTYSIFCSGDYIAKISDMGLGKQLVGQSSFGASALGDASLRGHSNGGQSSNAGAGPGSVGWQAPEVMAKRISSDASVRSDGSGLPITTDSVSDASPLDLTANTRTSRSVDIFSLGCIFYSLLLPGSHPFGEWYEREANIMHNRPNIGSLLAISADAYDLVSSMIQRNPLARPTAKQVCEHHFFWPIARRLAFLCDFSDRLETDAIGCDDDSSPSSYSSLLAVEKQAGKIVGVAWDSSLDDALVSTSQQFRTYDPSSIRDLLRLIRNKHHHFDELPDPLKDKIGTNTDGLMAYFEARFPSLLVHCVSVCRDSLPRDDAMVAKYSLTPIGRQAASREKNCSMSVTDTSLGWNKSKTQPSGDCFQLVDEVETVAQEGTEFTLAPILELDPPRPESSTEAAVDPTKNLAVPSANSEPVSEHDVEGVIVWEGSTAAKALNCRGWSRSDDDWERCTDVSLRKRDSVLKRCAEDSKFRTRLCNHWDVSLGKFCPMRKKGKCVFAHGPVELRVKEPKRGRWGKLVDPQGDNKNPNHSGGEDTYGAARSIETERKQEGKWNTNGKGRRPQQKKKLPALDS